jgi:hypothetical protein
MHLKNPIFLIYLNSSVWASNNGYI